MSQENELERLPCPLCGGTMKIARVIPRLGGRPELRTYECVECKKVVTIQIGE